MRCQELRPIMDSYLSDELLVETNHEVLRHLENCADCRGDLSDRRDLRIQLREAIRNTSESLINPIFAARVKMNLRNMALRPSAWERIMRGADLFGARNAAAAMATILLLIFGGLTMLQQDRSERPAAVAENNVPAVGVDNSDLASVIRASWQELTSQAVDDHENCAVDFKLEERPISLNEASKTFGAYNKELDKTVATALNAAFWENSADAAEIVDAHSCIYAGRRFTHLVVVQHERVVSILVTDSDLPGQGDSIHGEHFDDGLNVARFSVGHHAVFVVSQLNDAENTAIANAISPAIRLHMERVRA